MSERKAINKYYPPDYDPSQVTKVKRPTKMKVRLMSPFSMRCLTCNEYISSSRKFNATKDATGDAYMGVKIFRFTLLCPICNARIVFRTDPQNSGFELESGAKRNFEKKAKKVPSIETTEETLQRLLQESKQENEFKTLQDLRKKDPFGKLKVEDNLELKLAEQQRQNELNDHLEYLKVKNARIQNLKPIKLDNGENELIEKYNKFKTDKMPKGKINKEKKPIVLKKNDNKKLSIIKPVENITALKDDTEQPKESIKQEEDKVEPGLNLGYSSDDD